MNFDVGIKSSLKITKFVCVSNSCWLKYPRVVHYYVVPLIFVNSKIQDPIVTERKSGSGPLETNSQFSDLF